VFTQGSTMDTELHNHLASGKIPVLGTFGESAFTAWQHAPGHIVPFMCGNFDRSLILKRVPTRAVPPEVLTSATGPAAELVIRTFCRALDKLSKVTSADSLPCLVFVRYRDDEVDPIVSSAIEESQRSYGADRFRVFTLKRKNYATFVRLLAASSLVLQADEIGAVDVMTLQAASFGIPVLTSEGSDAAGILLTSLQHENAIDKLPSKPFLPPLSLTTTALWADRITALLTSSDKKAAHIVHESLVETDGWMDSIEQLLQQSGATPMSHTDKCSPAISITPADDEFLSPRTNTSSDRSRSVSIESDSSEKSARSDKIKCLPAPSLVYRSPPLSFAATSPNLLNLPDIASRPDLQRREILKVLQKNPRNNNNNNNNNNNLYDNV